MRAEAFENAHGGTAVLEVTKAALHAGFSHPALTCFVVHATPGETVALRNGICSLEFRVRGSGFGVQGLGPRVQDAGSRVWGVGFEVWGLPCAAP